MTAPETLAERLAKCVKPLEWVERFTDEGQRLMEARTSVGCYLATDEGWFLLGQGGWNTTLALEAAQAAAQADYTARILAALDMDAIARLVAEAVEAEREGCAQVAENFDGFMHGAASWPWRIAAAIRARAAQTEKER